MAKVLLVEDDNNLREIYQARLMAEGYDIVTAQNGEEALVVAKQNKPDLIISDVMMPRISGFEMLDILRNTEGFKHTPVIMLTALGQTDDQKRADNLGANKYLVKSQVTLDDIVNVAKELLEGTGASTAEPATPEPAATVPVPAPTPAEPVPVAPAPPVATEPGPAPAPATVTSEPAAPTPAPEPVAAPAPVPAPTPAVPAAAPVPEPSAAPTPQPATAPEPATPVIPDPLQVPDLSTPPTPAPEPASPIAPTEAVPAPATPEPVPAPIPEPTAAASEPAAPTPASVITPQPAAATAAADSLEAEEAALQAQIAGYSQAGDAISTPVTSETTESAPASPVETEAASDASNEAAIAEAVKELNTSTELAPASTADLATSSPVEPTPVAAPPAADTVPATNDTDNHVTVAGKKVIQPINDPTSKPDLNELLAKEAATDPAPSAMPNTTQTNPPTSTPGQSFDPTKAL